MDALNSLPDDHDDPAQLRAQSMILSSSSRTPDASLAPPAPSGLPAYLTERPPNYRRHTTVLSPRPIRSSPLAGPALAPDGNPAPEPGSSSSSSGDGEGDEASLSIVGNMSRNTSMTSMSTEKTSSHDHSLEKRKSRRVSFHAGLAKLKSMPTLSFSAPPHASSSSSHSSHSQSASDTSGPYAPTPPHPPFANKTKKSSSAPSSPASSLSHLLPPVHSASRPRLSASIPSNSSRRSSLLPSPSSGTSSAEANWLLQSQAPTFSRLGLKAEGVILPIAAGSKEARRMSMIRMPPPGIPSARSRPVSMNMTTERGAHSASSHASNPPTLVSDSPTSAHGQTHGGSSRKGKERERSPPNGGDFAGATPHTQFDPSAFRATSPPTMHRMSSVASLNTAASAGSIGSLGTVGSIGSVGSAPSFQSSTSAGGRPMTAPPALAVTKSTHPTIVKSPPTSAFQVLSRPPRAGSVSPPQSPTFCASPTSPASPAMPASPVDELGILVPVAAHMRERTNSLGVELQVNGVQVDVLGSALAGGGEDKRAQLGVDVDLEVLKLGSPPLISELTLERYGSASSAATAPSLASPEAGQEEYLRKRALSDAAHAPKVLVKPGRARAATVGKDAARVREREAEGTLERKGTLGRMWRRVVRSVTVRR